MPKIPFFETKISDTSIKAVCDVLASGWLTTGRVTQEFENNFAKVIGGNVQAIAVNSATAGLHLALEALGVGPGDEVIVPTLTFTASAEVVHYCGAEVVLVDVAPDTLCACPEKIEAAITDKTKAVVFVHFGGYPYDTSALYAKCRERGIGLVEDAAHAVPSRVGNRMIGDHTSDATVFSFYANKTMTTGEGGMLVTHLEGLANRARVMRTHGIDRDAFARFRGNSDQWQYDVIEAGFKYNLTDIASAVGLDQLAHVDDFCAARTQIADLYTRSLANLPIILPPKALAGSLHSWHLYPVQFTGGTSVRNQIIEAFSARDIGYSVHYTPLHKLTFWAENANLKHAPFGVADAYFQACLTLPMFPTMTKDQVATVVETITEVLT